MFSSYVEEQLKSYVYVLRDPRDDVIFYVGKGIGNRVFQHAKDALAADAETQMPLKLELIRDIQAAGKEVRTEILRFGLTGKEAYEVEAAAMQLLQRQPKSALTNIAAGHHVQARGWMSTGDAISLFEAPPAPDILEPVLLIKPTRLWFPGMSENELFEVTHGWWVVAPGRAGKAKYVLSVSRGVVRQVYLPESWRKQGPGDRGYVEGIGKDRWGFEGKAVQDDFAETVLGTDVTSYFPKGAQNSVRYLNC